MKKLLFLAFVIAGIFPSIGWAQNPYDDQNPVTIKPQVQVGTPDPAGPAVIPTAPADPLASATPEALEAHNILRNMIEKLNGYLKAKDFKKAGEAIKYIEQQTADVKTKKTQKLGLVSKMVQGGVDSTRIAEIRGKLASLKAATYRQMTATLLAKAPDFEDYDTSKGPGGGDVACAWFMSTVLRAAGMVPPGWNENLAAALPQRLVKEFGWQKNSPGKGRVMAASQMKPGDIVFWDPSDHVGIYLGDGMALSNSSSSHKGTIHPVSGYYAGWQPRYVVRPPGSKS